MSNGEHSLNSIECLKLVKKLILHIKEMVCCFDLDACVVEKRPYFVAHNEKVVLPQDNAPCHTTRNTLLENDVLGFSELSINHIQRTWHHWMSYMFLI